MTISHSRLFLSIGSALFTLAPYGWAAALEPVATRATQTAPKSIPSSETSTPTMAEDKSKTQNHVLQGNWNIYWYGINKVTYMSIAQASGSGGITTFMGGVSTLDKEACSTFCTVIDAAEAHYQDGPTTKTISMNAYVIIRVQCKNSQIWIEAFGLPSGKVLMSGRATVIDVNGQRKYLPVALGR